MEHFLFSINATMPVFLLIVLGYVLRQLGIFGEGFVREANRFNFVVTLPALLFRDLLHTDIAGEFDAGYVLFCAAATTIGFFAIWFISRRCIRDKYLIGAFVQASFRSSAAVMGIAFVQNMYGNSGMAPMMIIGAVPLFNIYAVLVLTFEAHEGQRQEATGKEKRQEAFYQVIKNPILIAIVLGICAALVQLQLPVILERSLTSVANLASPLALICLGAGFEGRSALAKIKPTLAASAVKLVILPAVFLPAAIWLGYRGEAIVALLMMLAAPATPSCYIMAKNMGQDGVLTSSVVVATTLLASVTLTGWIFLLRLLGIL